MKAPQQVDRLSLAGNDEGVGGAYPPLGFVPVWDAELGNGDFFGLYWPYGREKCEPIVCDMIHDECGLQIAFSNVTVFVDWLEINDWKRGDLDVNDPFLVPRRYREAKAKLASEPEQAISELQQICNDFPESHAYWNTLATQLRRIGELPSSHAAAIRAFASNWVFGLPNNATLRMLQSAEGQIDDPLVSRSSQFTMNYGGTVDNENYRLLKECISEYLSSPNPVLGLLLNQNYGYMMSSETTAFQERHSYDHKLWLEDHSRLSKEYLGDSRTQIQ